MQQITDFFSLKIDISLGTVIYSIHQNEIVPDYSEYFPEECIISIESSDFFQTALSCMKHAKQCNASLVFILSGECEFTIEPNDIYDVKSFKDTYDILGLNNLSDNDCFMLNKQALNKIDENNYAFTSWEQLNRNCSYSLKIGKLSSDLLVSNKKEIRKENIVVNKQVELKSEIKPQENNTEKINESNVTNSDSQLNTNNYNDFISPNVSSIFSVREKKTETIIKEDTQKEVINEPEKSITNNVTEQVPENVNDFRLWVYTLCYNEKKIIPFVVKYWKEYAEHVIVYDNGSDDGSIEELKKYDWIEVRHFDSDGLNDKTNMDLKNSCWKEAKGKNIDFVQVCDFDEVLWSDDIKKELLEFKKSSNSIWDSKCYEVCTKEFPLNADIFVHDNNDARCSYSSVMSKNILFRPDMIDEINYEPGAHGCKPKGNVSYYKNDNIKMFHLKHLSEEYYLEKFHLGAKRLSELNKKRGWGYQYNNNDEKLKNNYNDLYNKGVLMFSKNRLKVAVCAIAKMENHYIREWVEHYKKLGFDNIILYDNNDVDGERFDEVIDDYIKSGYVIVKDVRGKVGTVEWRRNYKSIQIECYDECFQTDAKKYDWIGFFDIDEFLMIEENDKNIKDILLDNRYNNYDAIKVCWKYYDDNDLVRVENNDYSCVKRFTHHNNINCYNNDYTKIIVKTSYKGTINSSHGFLNCNIKFNDNVKICDVFGNLQNNYSVTLDDRKQLHKKMWLNHYRCKTIEEYLYMKCKRNWPDNHDDVIKNSLLSLSVDNFFKYGNNKTPEKLQFILNYNQKIAVCGIAKNENRYIREWVEYYKKLGFDNIILCDNNDKDGEHFEDVINDYITSGYVKLEDYRGYVSNQSYGKDNQSTLGIAYKESYKKYYNNYDWILFCDIDEFLYIKDNKDIKQYLNNQKFEKLNGLRIYWKLYGDNNLIHYEDKPVLERFDYEDNSLLDVDNYFKTIVKTNIDVNSIKFNAHGPDNVNLNIPDSNMQKVNSTMRGNNFNNANIYLKHFYCKSTEEFFTRKYKKTSAVCGNKSPRNYSKLYLMRDSIHDWGYFKTNKKSDEKIKFINDFCNKKDRE